MLLFYLCSGTSRLTSWLFDTCVGLGFGSVGKPTWFDQINIFSESDYCLHRCVPTFVSVRLYVTTRVSFLELTWFTKWHVMVKLLLLFQVCNETDGVSSTLSRNAAEAWSFKEPEFTVLKQITVMSALKGENVVAFYVFFAHAFFLSCGNCCIKCCFFLEFTL